ncbi:MAG: OmpA family protein [Cyclobacteriaceae bacterium]
MRLFISLIFLNASSLLWAQSIQEKFRAVNSAYDEQNPVLSPDGQTLYFTIGNHPSNSGGKKDPGDIWFSRKEGSTWSSPVHGGSMLNDKAYNAVAGFSPEGHQLFLHGHYGSSGNVARTQGIAVSKHSGSGWSRPENISIPYFMNKSGILCGSLSADNSVLIFSAESYGTHGVDDIYVSVKDQGKWSEPKNLGSTINTQFQELSPSLSEDKTILYFSSNGRKGNGSFDIYSATRLDDTWTRWSGPENLGPQINSEGRELFYRFYPAIGFALYTTTKSSDGYGDLRVYTAPEQKPVQDTIVYASIGTEQTSDKTTSIQETLNTEAGAEQKAIEKIADETLVVTVHGKITNAKTGETIPAKISFQGPGLEPQSVASGENGYSIGVPSSQYTIRIESNGYISTLEKLDIKDLDMRNLEMNFVLQPVELGTTVNLKNVLFAQAKTDILPESFPELDLVVNFLKENPTVRIELMGHTDGRGVHADNVKLSRERVNKVKEYLESKGIEPRRISGKGFGGSKPIASNDTEESRRMNRRVEFVIRKF